MAVDRPKPPYEVRLTEEDWDKLKKLPRESQQEQAFTYLWGPISYAPTASIPGKIKALKEEYRGLYELVIGDGYRIIYRVDEAAKQVLIEEIGPHPDWRRSRGGRIRR